MLPNTSSTMLIELLSNAKICGSGEQVVNTYRSLKRPPPPISPIFSCTLTLLCARNVMVFFFIFIFFIYKPSFIHIFFKCLPYPSCDSCISLFCISLLAPQHFSWFLFQLYFFMVSLVLCVLYWRSSYWSSRCFEFTRALFSLCSTFIFSLCVLPQFLSSCHLVYFLLPLSFELYQHAKNGLLCFQIIHVKDIPLNLEISTKCFCGHRIQIHVHAVS